MVVNIKNVFLIGFFILFFFICLFSFHVEGELIQQSSQFANKFLERTIRFGYQLPDEILKPFAYKPEIRTMGLDIDGRLNYIKGFAIGSRLTPEQISFLLTLCDTDAYIKSLYLTGKIHDFTPYILNSISRQEHLDIWYDYVVKHMDISKYSDEDLLLIKKRAFFIWEHTNVRFRFI